MQKLFLPREYADLRRCSSKTLERERASGTGCPYVVIGRRIYYRLEDIDAFHASRVRRNTSESTESGPDAASKRQAQRPTSSGRTWLQPASEAECLTGAPGKPAGKPGQRS
jgi:hypothetical protein